MMTRHCTDYIQQAVFSLLITVVSILAVSYSAYALTGNIIDQCSDCHGIRSTSGAVRDIRPLDQNTPTAYRNISTGGFVGSHQAHLRDPQPSANVCSSCHTPVPTTMDHRTGSINMVSGLYSRGIMFNQTSLPPLGNCTTACHNAYSTATGITTPSWGQQASCSSCHAQTPTTGSHDAHTTAPTSAACILCHSGATSIVYNFSTTGTPHGNDKIDVSATLAYPSNVSKHPAGTYTGTCSTSCHNTYGTGGSTTPTWGQQAGCGACHNSSPTTGDHPKHVALASATCGTCHLGTTSVFGGTNHGNTYIDVSISPYPALITKHAPGTYTGTCSTNCHNAYSSTGLVTTPTWGQTTSCTTCHNYLVSSLGSHVGHVTTNSYDCSKCHAGASSTAGGTNHGDGNIDVAVANYPTNFARHTAGSGYSKCTSTQCHGGAGINLTWGQNLGTVQCTKCHGETNSAIGTNYSSATVAPGGTGKDLAGGTGVTVRGGTHQAHLTAATGLSDKIHCGECHKVVTSVNAATHMQYTTARPDFTGSVLAKAASHTPSVSRSTGIISCSNTYCHTGKLNTGSIMTPTWNNAALLPTAISITGCQTCHAFPPNTASGHPAATAPAGFPINGNNCSCHTNLSTSGNAYATIFVNKSQHINGITEGGHSVPYYANTNGHQGCTVGIGCHTNSAPTTAYASLANGTTPNCRACHAKADPTVANNGCGSCHGAASSTGTGEPTGTAHPDQAGSHAKHTPLTACTTCHAKGGSGANADHGPGNRRLNPALANVTTAGSRIGWNSSTLVCSTASCHNNGTGVATGVSVVVTSPSWGGTTTCTSCHGNPPNYADDTPKQNDHAAGGHSISCDNCHYNVTTNGSTISTPANHGNGTYNVTPNATKGITFTYAYAVGGGTCTATGGCHGTAQWGVTVLDCISCHGSTVSIKNGPLTGGTRAAVAASLKTSGTRNHKSTTIGLDASKFDCIVCHMEGNSTGATVAGIHGNGVLDFRDPDTGTQIKKVKWGGATYAQNLSDAAGRYADDTLTNFTTARFSRNLSVVLESDPAWLKIASIQKNLCLKCHDSNGAQSNLAWSKRQDGTSNNSRAQKPFSNHTTASTTTQYWVTGTLKTGAGNTTGGVMNVLTQFDPANASYHPVVARGNNGSVSGLAGIKAPWGNTTKSSVGTRFPANTIYGYLISCFDCHAASGATGIQSSTVVAHGNTNTAGTTPTMRSTRMTTTAVNGGATNLCTVCHADNYTVSGGHQAGTAKGSGASSLSTSMSAGTMGNCANCHGSATNNIGAQAVNGHGFDALEANGRTTFATSGQRPYSFFRGGSMTNWNYTTPTCTVSCTTGTYSPGGMY